MLISFEVRDFSGESVFAHDGLGGLLVDAESAGCPFESSPAVVEGFLNQLEPHLCWGMLLPVW